MTIHTLETLPCCVDPQRDSWLRTLVVRSVHFLLCEVGTHALEAVILTGSTARGEASVLPTAAGFRLLGDLEFLVIVRTPHDWPAIRRRMATLSRRATHIVGEEGHAATIEYGPAGRIYLQRNIRPSIFAYDLRTHGQVVWGQQDILTEMPTFGVADIPPADALNLLMNRMVEAAVLAGPTSQDASRAVHDCAYHLTKVVLDLAGSTLAFVGRYVSHYSKRGQGFRELLDTESDLGTVLPDPDRFQAVLEQAVTCKLEPTEARLVAPALRAAAHQQAAWGCGLWLWEVRRLLGLTAPSFRNALEAFVSHESLAVRLKGWTKFLGHPLRPAQALSWPRVMRLLFRASPQTLTYAAALLTQAGPSGAWGPDWTDRIASLSPVPVLARDSNLIAREIGALWQWLIRNN